MPTRSAVDIATAVATAVYVVQISCALCLFTLTGVIEHVHVFGRQYRGYFAVALTVLLAVSRVSGRCCYVRCSCTELLVRRDKVMHCALAASCLR